MKSWKRLFWGSFKTSQHELIDQALRGTELGNKRPATFLWHRTEGWREDPNSSTTCHSFVTSRSWKLDDFSKIAASMLYITTSNLADPFNIAADDMTNNMFDERHRSCWRTEVRQPPFRQTENRQVDGKSKFNVRPIYIGQIPGVCNPHIFYDFLFSKCLGSKNIKFMELWALVQLAQ